MLDRLDSRCFIIIPQGIFAEGTSRCPLSTFLSHAVEKDICWASCWLLEGALSLYVRGLMLMLRCVDVWRPKGSKISLSLTLRSLMTFMFDAKFMLRMLIYAYFWRVKILKGEKISWSRNLGDSYNMRVFHKKPSSNRVNQPTKNIWKRKEHKISTTARWACLRAQKWRIFRTSTSSCTNNPRAYGCVRRCRCFARDVFAMKMCGEEKRRSARRASEFIQCRHMAQMNCINSLCHFLPGKHSLPALLQGASVVTPDNGMNPNMRSFRHNGTMTATFPPSESIVMAELIKELELPVDYFPFSFSPRALLWWSRRFPAWHMPITFPSRSLVINTLEARTTRQLSIKGESTNFN